VIDKAKAGIVEGRIVHFVLPKGQVRAAIIVNAFKDDTNGEGRVNLCVFTDFVNDGLSLVEWRTAVSYDASARPGTWHWPDGHVTEHEPEATAEAAPPVETATPPETQPGTADAPEETAPATANPPVE
jgi:YD repeat-containing protein